ncbi:chitin synthase chs-2-like [Mytilus edulis]
MADESEIKTPPRVSNLHEKTLKTEPKGNDEDDGEKQKFKIKLKSSAFPLDEKILKIIFAIFLFIIVFGSCFIARITLHILIWHITPPIETQDSVINTLGGLLVSNCSICDTSTSNTTTFLPHSAAVDNTWIWALFLVITAPYFLTFFSTLFRLCFKSNAPLNCGVLLAVLLIETIHSIGISILAFLVLPAFDPASASVVYLAVAVIPPLIDIIDKTVNEPEEDDNEKKTKQSTGRETSKLSFFFPIFGFLLQIVGIVLIALYIKIGWLMGMFFMSAIFTSIKYWENFVDIGGDNPRFLCKVKWELHKGRTKVACLVNIWKIFVTFIAVMIIFSVQGQDSTSGLKSLFNSGISTLTSAFGDHTFGINPICTNRAPFIVAVISICCEYLCYKASKTVCVINCQRVGFSIPLVVVPIVTTLTLVSIMHQPEILKFSSCDLLFSTWCVKGIDQLIGNCTELFAAFFVLIASILLITRHIWKVNGYKHGETARMFVSNFYCGLFIDLSLLLNRRRNDKEYNRIFSKDTDTKIQTAKDEKEQKQPKMLYACCATMWHETANEMTQLLKSIFKLDANQFRNKIKDDLLMDEDAKEDYDLEAQVFFDDAFIPLKDGEKYPEVNSYVKTFIDCIYVAGREVHGDEVKVDDGTMYRTPYGARIEWALPGENKMVAHLKDKTKIRHKKRWSQVMYMYYILQWCIQEKYGDNGKQEALDNTYLLALDGDVDFEPEAVLSLMRRMNKSKIVGAACGRIHPIGSGPMVWYQKFEYAISHWLQKATEHVIGCVLCSPGCFSLFRGSALMHPEVLQKYTTIANEAQHYVQYDQGEDRWLCTLLLKQGWKVEYCAESDAYTFAPEGFYEFYNQRRRWTPSTMANILDIILDWKNVTKKNENISFLYIVYQMSLFVSTLLTPGTVFMIILGAIIVGFEEIPPYVSLLLNLFPVTLFLLMTLYASSQRQLQLAAVLSAIYVIVMMIVMIGVVKDAIEEGLCSMTTIFIIFVAGVFVVSALIHPKEFFCIIPGLLYFVAIPSMSMLMFLYSIGNLHIVSWGTRETKETTDNTKPDKKFKPEKEEKGYFCSLGKFFSCMFCPTNDYNKDDFLYSNMMNEVRDVREIMKDKEEPKEKEMLDKVDQATQVRQTDIDKEQQPEIENKKKEEPIQWHIYADKTAELISKEERKFWKKYIKKYLAPLPKDTNKEKEVEEALIDLRNRACLFVYLLNAILVTVMFGLTQVNAFKDSLSVDFECSGGTIQLVPIAILFTAVFGLLLLLQFLCMLYHRFSTLVHICATTEIWESVSTHTDKTTAEFADFLTSPVIVPVAPTTTTYTDKDRKFMNLKTSIAQLGGKKFKNLRDVVNANWKKAPLQDLKGSLFSRNEEIAKKVMAKWQIVKDKTVVKEEPKLMNIVAAAQQRKKNEKKEKSGASGNKVEPFDRKRSGSSSSEGEGHKTKSDNSNVKFGSDSNV